MYEYDYITLNFITTMSQPNWQFSILYITWCYRCCSSYIVLFPTLSQNIESTGINKVGLVAFQRKKCLRNRVDQSCSCIIAIGTKILRILPCKFPCYANIVYLAFPLMKFAKTCLCYALILDVCLPTSYSKFSIVIYKHLR